MRRVRIIPVLLLKGGGLYKSVRFKNYRYVGDPINAVKIFNEKEVDEVIVLDIDATVQNRSPNIKQIKEITSEAFMPMAYGGGIASIEQVRSILSAGVEKVIFNYSAFYNPKLVEKTIQYFGSSTVVAAIDVKRDWLGKQKAYCLNGSKNTKRTPKEAAQEMQQLGVGEIFLNNIDRDGTFSGFDMDLISLVSNAVNIPLIACGGANSLVDFKNAIKSGASASAAGSYFVFQRPHNAVLITYPSQEELSSKVYSQL